jgi:hypothetical protein
LTSIVVVAVVLTLVAVAMVAAMVPVMVQINMVASWTTGQTVPRDPPVRRASMMSTHAASTMVRRRRLIKSCAPAPRYAFLPARRRPRRPEVAHLTSFGAVGHRGVLGGRKPASIADGFVASARLPAFHKADCKSAAKISEKNLVRYNTRDEAIQAGKKPDPTPFVPTKDNQAIENKRANAVKPTTEGVTMTATTPRTKPQPSTGFRKIVTGASPMKLIAILALACHAAYAAEALPKGHVFFHTDFGGKKLAVEKPSIVSLKLPVEEMRGYTVRGTALIKADNVTVDANTWNGVRFMLVIDTPTGKRQPRAGIGAGSFAWQRVTFTAKIPADATAVTLCLGLESVTGTVTFDAVTFAVAKAPPTGLPRVATGPPFKGHDLPRLRGTMINSNITAESLRTLGRDWRANLIRWPLVRTETNTDYDQWLERELQKLDGALPVCAKVGLRVVVDLCSPAGGKEAFGWVWSNDRLFTDKSCQQKFVADWRRIAKRYKDAKPIWGYDLANEPIDTVVADDCDDWHALAERAASAIRAIDPARAIIVEATLGSVPESLAEFTPIDVSNVVYSAHMYVPFEFTAQGVGSLPTPVNYPGAINGKLWDKAALEKALRPVVDFQETYNVHIYIGEFSAVRWAPDNSAYRYLKDVIDIFESHNWDWSYHAFREWNGWSVEHGPDRQNNQPVPSPTDRQRLLCDWFAKNQKPRQ